MPQISPTVTSRSPLATILRRPSEVEAEATLATYLTGLPKSSVFLPMQTPTQKKAETRFQTMQKKEAAARKTAVKTAPKSRSRSRRSGKYAYRYGYQATKNI